MNVELGKLPNGNMVIFTDSPFPSDVKRVEYYRDQRLIMLVYDDPDSDGDLMQYELTPKSDEAIRRSPYALVVTAEPGKEMLGYDVPVVQVGDIY